MELSAAQDPKDVAADLRKRFASLRRSTSFVDWRKQRALVRDLEGLLAMIETAIAPQDANEAFELPFIRQMDARSKGITDFRKRLYWDDFRDCLTILPPKEEQTEIIQYAAGASDQIETAIKIKKDQISALKEYKTSLINAAVTGKIRVT